MTGSGNQGGHDDTRRSAADRLRPGDVFACQWRLDRALGAGGMAQVFSATHVTGRRDALKVLHAHLAADPGAVARFLREAELCRCVQHAGATRVIDAGIAPDGRAYIAMELLRGATLDALWKRAKSPLPPRAVLRSMAKVLDVLAACHAQGVVHRDIKPSNVFLTDGGEVRLLDFGVGSAPGFDDMAKPGVALGTPGYMAPEQAAGAWEHVDATSDVFSAGATIHALVSGVRVHAVDDERVAFRVAASKAALSLAAAMPDAPAALVELVDRALLWDKRKRFPDARAMHAAVVDVLSKLGGEADGALPMSAARKRALHAELLNGTEPPGVAALVQAMSWLDDYLRASSPVRSSYDAALSAAQRWLEECAAAAGGPVDIQVMPFGFRAFGHAVWDPAPALDVVPRRLHAAGVRALRIDPARSPHAARDLASVLIDSTRDDGGALAHRVWSATGAGLSAELIRPFALLEAAYGSDVASEIAKVAQGVGDHPNTNAANPLAIVAVPSPSRLEDRLSADRRAAIDEVGRRVVGADRSNVWRRAEQSLISSAQPGELAWLVRSLASSGTPADRDCVVRIASRRWSAAAELARGELCGDRSEVERGVASCLDGHDEQERLVAYTIAAELQLTTAARTVLARLAAPDLVTLSPREREAMLTLVMMGLPGDGERAAVRLLQKHGVLADESHDATRRIAARLLGRYGSGGAALDALRAATSSMWWNSRGLRDEAALACREIEARLHAQRSGDPDG